MKSKVTRALAACLSAMLVTACGGGGGSTPNSSAHTEAHLVPVILPGPVSTNSPAPPTGDSYSMALAIPPRVQWNANYGYCGEMSFISAGLYYGQYVSQFAARAAATPGIQQNDVNSQLLISLNDQSAAATMHLTATEWNWQASSATTNQFLSWVKGYVVAGYPVIIGVYVNRRDGTARGFSSYDHIVPVTGIASNHPLVPGLDQVYYADDILQLGDNSGNVFQYAFGAFQMTRTQANAPQGPPFGLALHTSSDTFNAAVAVTGVIDLDYETVPVRLATNLNAETPAIANGAITEPTAQPVTLTATVYGLTPGVSYNVYQYNALASIPNSAFNAHAAAAYQKYTFTATGSTYVLPAIDIMSNQVAAFRAVPASAH
ncbi:MAG: C39 family peptidase [Massilia sp.]